MHAQGSMFALSIAANPQDSYLIVRAGLRMKQVFELLRVRKDSLRTFKGLHHRLKSDSDKEPTSVELCWAAVLEL